MEQFEAKHIKKGMYVLIKKRPCRVVDYEICKPGKHGHVKVCVTGLDVLNQNKIINIYAGHDKICEFKLDKSVCQLNNVEDDILYYLKENSEKSIRIDIQSNLYEEIKCQFENGENIMITIIKAPIEIDENVYEFEELVETFKIDR